MKISKTKKLNRLKKTITKVLMINVIELFKSNLKTSKDK